MTAPCPDCASRPDGKPCFWCWLGLPLELKAANRPAPERAHDDRKKAA